MKSVLKSVWVWDARWVEVAAAVPILQAIALAERLRGDGRMVRVRIGGPVKPGSYDND